jgi:hypothetical protein
LRGQIAIPASNCLKTAGCNMPLRSVFLFGITK